MSTANETPICDDQLLAFDETAHDNRCSINMYWYKRIRERLRLAEIGGMEAGQCASCRPAFAEMHKLRVERDAAMAERDEARSDRDALASQLAKANAANY